MHKLRYHSKIWIITILLAGILLIFARNDALAAVIIGRSPDRQYQTVPTQPPPTKSPTITPFTTQPGPPVNTTTQSPQPSAAVTQGTSLPLTQTAEIIASSTISTGPSNPTTNPTIAKTADAGTNTPGTTTLLLTATATSREADGAEGGGRLIWWYGLILAVVILVLAVSLYIWLHRKRRAEGDSSTEEPK